jgi:hypothetical protein
VVPRGGNRREPAAFGTVEDLSTVPGIDIFSMRRDFSLFETSTVGPGADCRRHTINHCYSIT